MTILDRIFRTVEPKRVEDSESDSHSHTVEFCEGNNPVWVVEKEGETWGELRLKHRETGREYRMYPDGRVQELEELADE